MKAQKWFEGFDWDAMERLELPVPYVPVVKSHTDLTSCFATEEDMPRIVEYHDPGTGWDQDFATVPDVVLAAPGVALLSDRLRHVSCSSIAVALAWFTGWQIA